MCWWHEGYRGCCITAGVTIWIPKWAQGCVTPFPPTEKVQWCTLQEDTSQNGGFSVWLCIMAWLWSFFFLFFFKHQTFAWISGFLNTEKLTWNNKRLTLFMVATDTLAFKVFFIYVYIYRCATFDVTNLPENRELHIPLKLTVFITQLIVLPVLHLVQYKTQHHICTLFLMVKTKWCSCQTFYSLCIYSDQRWSQ